MFLALLLAMMANAPATTQSSVLLDEDFHNFKRWHLEGLKDGVSITDMGELRLACDGSKQGSYGTMAFCRQDFPDNIAVEFDFLVENHNGLFITFVAMQGVNGEDAIEGVPPRQGVFEDYVGKNASTRSYHVSICRYDDEGKHTGVSNWRRNPGLHLMVSGEDLCKDIGKKYHVKITKRGPMCAVEVDGKPGAQFIDPQTLPGPIPTTGKIGFRAIGAKAVFRISNLKVTVLPPEK
jgi:hypothetical protein